MQVMIFLKRDRDVRMLQNHITNEIERKYIHSTQISHGFTSASVSIVCMFLCLLLIFYCLSLEVNHM